ncbi:response regulator transcription factor [Anaerosporobacter sp.]|uniref:response regulator transcription factor n=1 Tax=Anaerosporobacter sp. TaxID=1872529 RepID=UPI00286FA180|nr:response regulator transcription factor [Anaerosporobacter sp.]
MAQKILIIEDELEIQNILYELLNDAGYDVYHAADGMEGVNTFYSEKPDLVLLDILMPKLDGFSVCEMIRKQSNVPIIILTALDTEDSQIKGFELLADDYITKPFSLKLVLKRVEAILRRSIERQEAEVLKYRDIIMNTESRQVFVATKEVILTHLEFDILQLFLKNKGRVFTRDDVINYVWGYDFVGDEKGVNFHIMNIRRKLVVPCIETVRGVGYRVDKDR